MKLTVQLNQDDLVKFNEYHCAHSPIITKARRRNRILVPIIYLVIAVLGGLILDFAFATIFVVLALLWFLIFPRNVKRNTRKHLQKFINENFSEVDKEPSTIELNDDGIHDISHTGHSIFKYSAIDRIIENGDVTYVFIGKGRALVIPHDRVSEADRSAFIDEINRRKNQIANKGMDLTGKTPVD